MVDLTHASFFSGVGGLDMGLERAGWRTVSFSEIDPYASAVLAQRWPGVPNLGNITSVASEDRGNGQLRAGRDHWTRADLWTGGFPCQDLSVAGKRRGMGAGTRSGLAYSFLALAERHRPRFVLLENVPGLLSSHGGRDMAALVGALVELGYGVGYRVLDARHFGVPQRRRRVFILGLTPGGRAGAERAAEVLSIGSRCRRHPPTGIEAGEGAPEGAGDGADFVGSLSADGINKNATQNVAAGDYIGTLDTSDGREGRDSISRYSQTDGSPSEQSPDSGYEGTAERRDQPSLHRAIQRQAPDPDRMRAPDGLAGRLDGGEVVAIHADAARDGVNRVPGPDAEGRVRLRDAGLGVSDDGTMFTLAAAAQHSVFVKGKRAQTTEDDESWRADTVTPTLNAFDVGDTRATTLVAGTVGPSPDPDGLDSNRYRVVGNGVVAPVAEWIGLRLADYFRALP